MNRKSSDMKHYVNSVWKHLHLPAKIKNRVMSDFETTISALREQGLDDRQIMEQLGTPQEAAAGLDAQMEEFVLHRNPWRFAFLILAALSLLWLVGFYVLPRLMLLRLTAGAASVGVIGGADGPTSIFISGPTGAQLDVIAALVLLIVGIVGYLLLRRGKKRRK